MIFKTITDDVTGANKSVGLFGKTLNDFKGIVNSFKQNGIVSTLLNTPLINIDENAINNYNNAIKASIPFEKALDIARKTTNADTIALIESSNGLEIQTERVTAAQKASTIAAKAGSVALKALSMAGNMIAMWAITKILELTVKGIDNLIHRTENAKKRINELSDSLKDGVSKFDSLSNELESVNNQIDEILSKGKIEFTDQEELEKLRQQRLELERQLAIQEELNKQKASELSNEIWKDSDTLNKNFDKDLTNYSEKLSELNALKEKGLKWISEGFMSQENYDYTIEAEQRKLDAFYSSLLDDIQNFENNRSALINKYNGDLSKMSITDKTLLDDINKRLNEAYKEIYSQSEYNRLIIEPVFATEGLDNLQQEITDYFINNGSLDVEALEEKFGTDIIDALRVACEKAGIEFEQLLDDLYNQSNMTSYGFAPMVNMPNNAYEAKQNSLSRAKLNFYNSLDDETKKLIIEAEIPDNIKTGTLEDFKRFIKELQANAQVSVEPEIDTTTIAENISDLKDLNNELDKLGSAMSNIDANGKFELNDLDSIADYFLGLENIPYDIEAVNNSLKSLGSENATLEEQADAINTLADQYLKTSGILDDLTTENAELIKLQLQRMGITNAEEIVNATLNGTLQSQAEIEAILAQHKSIVTGETLTLTNVTAEEIQRLIAEGKVTNETANQMVILAIKKQLVNGNILNTSSDINNLISLCQMLGATTTALERYNQVKNGANGMPSSVIDSYKKAAEKELQDAIKTGQSSLNATYTSVPKAIYNGGANVAKALDDANKAAQSSAKETEDTYEELFDFFERRIDVLNNALELLNANLENVIGSNGKNQLIDAQIGINKESINNYTDALAMYQFKANEALSKIPAEFQNKIVNGAVALTDFIGSGNEDLVDAIKEYQEWADKVADCQQELAELKETIRQLELDKFNNIIEDFTNQFDISSNAQDLINKQIDLFKEAGELIGKGFYEGLIKESEGQLNILEREKQSLINELNSGLESGLIEKGADEWLEMVNALKDVDASILDCKKDIEEFNNAIQQLHWDIIERIQKNFDDLSSEIRNLVGLIDDVDVSDAEGVWSNEGLTQLGLYAQEYEKAIYAVQMYEDEIYELNNAYLRGEYSATEYADKLSELKDAQWDEINASESAKDAIMELNKARIEIMVDAIEKEIEAMKELIDSKKEALDAEEELYEYRKSITEKTKSVTDLERQIAAMENDNTSSSIAKRKKLEEELSKAKQDLADYEYEHSIDVQKDALDQQYEDFETEKNAEIEKLRATLDDMEAVIALSFETVKNNAQLIGNEIAFIAQTHGAIVSESLITAWSSGENAIASYGATLDAGASNFLVNMGNMVQGVYGLQNQADITALSLANMYNTSSANLQNELVSSYYSVANLNAVTQALNDSLINTLGRGYDVSSLVNSINSIGSAASSAASQVGALMSALSGAYSGNQGTYQDMYQGDSNNKNNLVRVTDKNGKTSVMTRQQAQQKGYVSKYAKGGLVTKDDDNPLNNIAKSVGEDVLIAAKEGEIVLTPAEADAFMKLASNIVSFNNSVPKLDYSDLMPYVPSMEKSAPSVQIHYDNLVQVQGDVNNSNIKQMEQIVNNAITKQFNQFNSGLRKAGVR